MPLATNSKQLKYQIALKYSFSYPTKISTVFFSFIPCVSSLCEHNQNRKEWWFYSLFLFRKFHLLLITIRPIALGWHWYSRILKNCLHFLILSSWFNFQKFTFSTLLTGSDSLSFPMDSLSLSHWLSRNEIPIRIYDFM